MFRAFTINGGRRAASTSTEDDNAEESSEQALQSTERSRSDSVREGPIGQGLSREDKGKGKRRRQDSDGNQSQDDEDEHGPVQKQTRVLDTDLPRREKLFACPYHQRDPDLHRTRRSCVGPGFNEVRRTKYVPPYNISLSVCAAHRQQRTYISLPSPEDTMSTLLHGVRIQHIASVTSKG